jgi:hypothetical protein
MCERVVEKTQRGRKKEGEKEEERQRKREIL